VLWLIQYGGLGVDEVPEGCLSHHANAAPPPRVTRHGVEHSMSLRTNSEFDDFSGGTNRMADGHIVVSGLTKQFGKVRAVDNLSFTVNPGRVTGFLGPNGAGKTTTLRMALGLVRPTSGTATIGGVRYADLPQPLRTVGAILEASSAHKGRTARNHLRVICATAGFPASRADEVLAMVGLTAAAKRKFRQYSLGMKQRLGIAAALLGDPQVLILDEPANGLDPEGIRWMRDLLKSLAREGRTVLVSSHLLSEVELLADDVVIVAGGRLVRQGTVEEVTGSMAHAQRIRVRTPNADSLAAALTGASSGVDGAAQVSVQPGSTPDLLYVAGLEAPQVGRAALAAGVELHELVAEKPDLEDVFLQLTGGQGIASGANLGPAAGQPVSLGAVQQAPPAGQPAASGGTVVQR
jgi:ABC-2 type transport system ATP-binding protein